MPANIKDINKAAEKSKISKSSPVERLLTDVTAVCGTFSEEQPFKAGGQPEGWVMRIMPDTGKLYEGVFLHEWDKAIYIKKNNKKNKKNQYYQFLND